MGIAVCVRPGVVISSQLVRIALNIPASLRLNVSGDPKIYVAAEMNCDIPTLENSLTTQAPFYATIGTPDLLPLSDGNQLLYLPLNFGHNPYVLEKREDRGMRGLQSRLEAIDHLLHPMPGSEFTLLPLPWPYIPLATLVVGATLPPPILQQFGRVIDQVRSNSILISNLLFISAGTTNLEKEFSLGRNRSLAQILQQTRPTHGGGAELGQDVQDEFKASPIKMIDPYEAEMSIPIVEADEPKQPGSPMPSHIPATWTTPGHRLDQIFDPGDGYWEVPNAKVFCLPAPLEKTVTYGKGTSKGPRAIIAASQEIEHYDIALKCVPIETFGIHTLPELPMPANIQSCLDLITFEVAKIVKQNKFPLVLGGEHTITQAVSRGIVTARPESFTVVILDAHADLRNKYEGSANSHACVSRRLLEQPWVEQVLILGVRSLSQEENDFISLCPPNKLKIWTAESIHKIDDMNWLVRDSLVGWDLELENRIRSRRVYLSIDVDCLDSFDSTGTPEPGGLEYSEVLDILSVIATHCKVIGIDCVELAPKPDSPANDFTIARILYKTLAYIFNPDKVREMSAFKVAESKKGKSRKQSNKRSMIGLLERTALIPPGKITPPVPPDQILQDNQEDMEEAGAAEVWHAIHNLERAAKLKHRIENSNFPEFNSSSPQSPKRPKSKKKHH